MAELKKVVEFLNDYLKISEIKDNSWNGLQIEGKPKVGKIAFAVDAGASVFKKAIREKVDMLVVHHGHFWKTTNPSIAGWSKKRIDLLRENGISLYACHLPLDRHKTVGNNAQLLKLLGAKIKGEFLEKEGKNISWLGEFKNPVPIEKIKEKLNSELKAKCLVFQFGKKKIKTIAVCSGGGGYSGFSEALNKKVDLYLTGDSIEIYHLAKDIGLNVIFAGHYATETIGVKALSEVVKRKFKVKTVFIDIATGL